MVKQNFDTDLFLPIIHATEQYAKHSYSEKEYKMAYRVIADHIRTVTFAIADGAMFSNEVVDMYYVVYYVVQYVMVLS